MEEFIKKKIEKAVDKICADVCDALSDSELSLHIDISTDFPENRTFRTSVRKTPGGSDEKTGENFWDLGKPREKKYAAPSFDDHSVGVTDIEDDSDETRSAKSEKIPPRSASSGSSSPRIVNTVDGPRYATGSYRSHSVHSRIAREKTAQRRTVGKILRSYSPDSILIRKIDVKTWQTDAEFYGRFASDALSSSSSSPSVPYTEPLAPVPYNSYVPQYSHMSRSQIEYYLWLRENIRHGSFPECDASYIQLYIFEIINLPSDVILPSDGAAALAKIWLGYRKTYPRLDGYLCEWMADYCMIHGISLPDEIRSIRHEIAHKSQFKEFYLDMSKNPTKDELIDTAKALIEVSSDYDYRTSRYYPDHSVEYEEHIPRAIAAVLEDSYKNERGILSLDRVYKMTRDTYCGAIVSSGVKMRLDIEFMSFTRRADSRQSVTAIVKYAENKVRTAVGIKAKLGCDKADTCDTAVIDRYFAPYIKEKVKKSADDRYMPDDYLKKYESDDTGFDYSSALEIEQRSWVNTTRLTGEEYGDNTSGSVIAEENGISDTLEESEPIEGEIGSDTTFLPNETEAKEENTVSEHAENGTGGTGDDIKEAVRAVLDGRFSEYCRSNGLFEGDAADRINNIFLEEIGDIILLDEGVGYTLIEDYRSDTEQWLST